MMSLWKGELDLILSGKEIEKRIGKDIFIDPFDPSKLNPNSYNLTLSNDLIVYPNDLLDMRHENPYREIKIPKRGFIMTPSRIYLGRTNERTKTLNLVPMIEGRSSIGRLGLYIHVTAGFGDVGFDGYWTLELHCIQPIIIYPNIDICQIFYHTIEGDYEPYNSKYQGNNGIQTSQLWKEFKNNDKN